MLGVYVPPAIEFKNYGRYVDAAFAVPANRERANQIFLSLVRQIAELWGTVLGVRVSRAVSRLWGAMLGCGVFG